MDGEQTRNVITGQGHGLLVYLSDWVRRSGDFQGGRWMVTSGVVFDVGRVGNPDPVAKFH